MLNPVTRGEPVENTSPTLTKMKVVYFYSKYDVRQYQRYFQWGMYENYYKQLQAFVEDENTRDTHLISDLNNRDLNSFQLKFSKFRAFLCQEIGMSYPEMKEFHASLIDQLRSLLRDKPDQEHMGDELSLRCLDFIDQICLWMYTKVDLDQSMEEFCERKNLMKSSEHMPNLNYASLFIEIGNLVARDEDFNNIRMDSLETHDGHRLGQLTHRAYRLEEAHTQVIYTGHVTRETYVRNVIQDSYSLVVSVIPEFVNYLESLAKTSRRHLAVTLLNRQCEEESISSQTFVNLEKNEEVNQALLVIALDKNSDFYCQNNMYSTHSLPYDQFKTVFLERLFDPGESSFFHFSPKLDHNEWKNECANIMDNVHAEYFSKCSELLIDERRAFIDIVYMKIIVKICKENSIDFCSIHCWHGVDRTACLLAGLYFDQKYGSNEDLDFEEACKLINLQFSPALLGHNRPPNDYFTKRNILAMRYTHARKYGEYPMPKSNTA